MKKLLILVSLLFATPSFADLELTATSKSGVSANYWVVSWAQLNISKLVGSSNTEFVVLLRLYKDKAAYDAGNGHLDELTLTWLQADLTSFSTIDLSDDGSDILDKSYTKIKTLNAVSFNGGTLDFTTAVEPTP